MECHELHRLRPDDHLVCISIERFNYHKNLPLFVSTCGEIFITYVSPPLTSTKNAWHTFMNEWRQRWCCRRREKNESECKNSSWIVIYEEKRCNSFHVIPQQPSHTHIRRYCLSLELETNTHIHNRQKVREKNYDDYTQRIIHKFYSFWWCLVATDNQNTQSRRESETQKGRSRSKHTKKLYFGQKISSSLSCATAITPRGFQTKKWTSNSRIIDYEFFMLFYGLYTTLWRVLKEIFQINDDGIIISIKYMTTSFASHCS